MLLTKLKQLDTVTKALQDECVTLAEARGLFDEVMAYFPCTKARLGTAANIIENKTFEMAIVKIQSKKEKNLTAAESRTVRDLLKIDRAHVSYSSSAALPTLDAEKVLKRIRTDEEEFCGDFMGLRFILATSNVCERLFSKAGFAFTARRHRMLPANLECQMYLHVNSSFWGIADAQNVLQ